MIGAKGSSGLVPFPTTPIRPISPPSVRMLRGNLKEVSRASSIGRSSLLSARKHHSKLFGEYMETSTSSLPDPKLPPIMYGKTTQGSEEPSLSWVRNLSDLILKPTGSPSGPPPSPETCQPSQRRYEFAVTSPFEASQVIMHRLDQLNDNVKCFGEPPALVSRKELGTKGVYLLTVKIPAQSSGTVTAVRKMLSSTSLEEVSCATNLGIDICHMLRWLDRYPVRVEIKGSSRPLCARKIWITSNIHPRQWYPEIDGETLAALMRRLNITQFH